MKLWYVVEERAEYNAQTKEIGASVSAEIVDVKPRNTSGYQGWHDTETVEHGVYTRKKWCRTKKEANDEIRFWMTR